MLNQTLLKKQPPDLLLDKEENLRYDAKIIANNFADSMEKQFGTSDTHSWVDDLVKKSIYQHNNSIHKKTLFFTSGEVWNFIRFLPNRSVPGPYTISNSTLKHSGKKVATIFCQIFSTAAQDFNISLINGRKPRL